MERLTDYHVGENGAYMKCSGNCRGGLCENCEELEKIIDRLAAYEDTMTIERAKELAQAEKDGRLVVLPCKVGDKVWFIQPYTEEITEETIDKIVAKGRGLYMKLSCNKMYETSCNSIGKTVFLTREGAEAALKKREADNEAD